MKAGLTFICVAQCIDTTVCVFTWTLCVLNGVSLCRWWLCVVSLSCSIVRRSLMMQRSEPSASSTTVVDKASVCVSVCVC